MPMTSLDRRKDEAMVLVHVAHSFGSRIELLRAEQLLVEAQRSWPAPRGTRRLWFAEAVKSLGLRTRTVTLCLDNALRICEDGAILVGGLADDGEAFVLLRGRNRKVEIFGPGGDGRHSVSLKELETIVAHSSPKAATHQPVEFKWLVIEDPTLDRGTSHKYQHRPIRRLLALLQPEATDIWIVSVFAFFAGILSLDTPIAVETLVNTVAFGRLMQPLIILSLMLFAFLAFAGAMQAMQTFAVEVIQRRLFVRVAADLAYRFPRVKGTSLSGHYGPEVANRFFDVVTLQKIVALLLLDGVSITLGTAVGMAVLAFYHPWLLGFDILLLILVVGGIWVFGDGAIASGIDESRQKYRLAAWLEDLIRCPISFKSAGAADFALDRANEVTSGYLKSRQQHFRILFRQLLFIFVLQAIAGTVLLAFGGWLVIQGQLTLGQLVAAELIVATILGRCQSWGNISKDFTTWSLPSTNLGTFLTWRLKGSTACWSFRPEEVCAYDSTTSHSRFQHTNRCQSARSQLNLGKRLRC
ncbi:MAG: hypothetical protein R3C10_26095 [Pirellulales bacterium]